MHEGIGKWGLMGQGTWVGKGNAPPHMEAWSKLWLRWVDATVIEQTTLGVSLPAVTEQPLVVKIPAIRSRPSAAHGWISIHASGAPSSPCFGASRRNEIEDRITPIGRRVRSMEAS